MALQESPQPRNGCSAPNYTHAQGTRRDPLGRWEGLGCWFERRPVVIRLALVVLVSLTLWTVITLGAASLFA